MPVSRFVSNVLAMSSLLHHVHALPQRRLSLAPHRWKDPEIAAALRHGVAVLLEVVQDQIGHLRADLPHHGAAHIAVIPAGAAGAVAVQADGEHIGIRHGLSLHGHGSDPLPHRAGNVIGVGHAHVVVVVVMLHLRLQEAVRHPQGAVVVPGKVRRAALHRLPQNSAGDLQHRQRVGVGVGDQQIAPPHHPREPRRVVGQAGGGQLRAAGPKLHRVEQIGEAAASGRHVQRRVRHQRLRQMAHHLIQPVLGAALHAGELVQPLPAACTGCGDRLAGEALARFGYGRLDVQEFLSPVGGLHHESTAQRLPVDGHVLVPCQQKVKVQLLAQAVGHVLVGGGQHAAGGQISLEAAVINAQRHIHPAPQGFQRRTRGGDRVADSDAGQVLRLLPDVHVVGDDAHDADPQAVLQRVDAGREAHAGAVPADILADAAGVQSVEIAVQIVHAVVEVVVAQGHIVVAAAVHYLGEPAGVAQCVMAVGTQGRALQDIAAVDDQRVPVLMKLAGTLEQTDIPLLPAAVVGGIDITMEVRGEVDGKAFCVHRLTPVPA